MNDDLERLTDRELRERALAMLKSAGCPYEDFLPPMDTSREGFLNLIVDMNTVLIGLGWSKAMPEPEQAWEYIEYWVISYALVKLKPELKEFLANLDRSSSLTGVLR